MQITPDTLLALRRQLIEQHQQDLDALDRIIGRLHIPALPAPIAPIGKQLHVDKVIARHKAKREKQAAALAPQSHAKRKFGWFQEALKQYVADQIQPFTSEQVRTHLAVKFTDVKASVWYQIPAGLLTLRERGLVEREGTGRASLWRKVGDWTFDEEAPVADRYQQFRSSLQIAIPKED